MQNRQRLFKAMNTSNKFNISEIQQQHIIHILPQLLQTTLIRYYLIHCSNDQLKEFFNCIYNNLFLYLKIKNYINSLLDDKQPVKTQLLNLLQMKMINGQKANQMTILSQEELIKEYKSKQYKAIGQEYIINIFKQLVNISIDLNELKACQRSSYLKKSLQKINEDIIKLSYQTQNYFSGLLFPFQITQNCQHYVLQIDEQRFYQFKTKKRCPYLIFFKIKQQPFLTRKHAIQKLKKQINKTKKLEQLENQFQIIVDDQLFISKPKYLYPLDSFGLIVKANDDIRQQVIIMQFMITLKFILSPLNIYLRPYQIFLISNNSGFIQYIQQTASIDLIKKSFGSFETFFQNKFGENIENARQCFLSSLVGYSIFTYLFIVRDRHNANILMDTDGHLIHIDFSFILGQSPGGMGFETAPFKLTSQYVDILGGRKSILFKQFQKRMVIGFKQIVANKELLSNQFDVFKKYSKLQCFKSKCVIRFPEQNQDIEQLVQDLIYQSHNNNSTKTYDKFQKLTNNIYD